MMTPDNTPDVDFTDTYILIEPINESDNDGNSIQLKNMYQMTFAEFMECYKNILFPGADAFTQTMLPKHKSTMIQAVEQSNTYAQTDTLAVSSKTSQTHTVNFSSATCQTDRISMSKHATCQTAKVSQSNATCQTGCVKTLNAICQTGRMALKNTTCQTSKVEVLSATCQTDKESLPSVGCQTDKENLPSIGCQTDKENLPNFGCQTDTTELISVSVQSENQDLQQKYSQTDETKESGALVQYSKEVVSTLISHDVYINKEISELCAADSSADDSEWCNNGSKVQIRVPMGERGTFVIEGTVGGCKDGTKVETYVHNDDVKVKTDEGHTDDVKEEANEEHNDEIRLKRVEVYKDDVVPETFKDDAFGEDEEQQIEDDDVIYLNPCSENEFSDGGVVSDDSKEAREGMLSVKCGKLTKVFINNWWPHRIFTFFTLQNALYQQSWAFLYKFSARERTCTCKYALEL